MASLLRAVMVPILLAVAVSACATSRSVVDVRVPDSATSNAEAATGYAKITDVRDLRKFAVNPRDPSLPSIGNEAEIADPAVTSRAIGRKRNTYGQALGDIMLPEGRSVSDLVREAARKALQEKGYTVVDEGSSEYAKAVPLAVDVGQFWAWMTPGFWEITLRFESRLMLKGNELIGANPAPVESRATLGTGGAFESTWAEVIRNGVDDLTEKIKEKLRSPADVAQR